MTGSRRGRGRRRAAHPQGEPEAWLLAALMKAASAYEPDAARIRERIAGPGDEPRTSNAPHPRVHSRRRGRGARRVTGHPWSSRNRPSRLLHHPTVIVIGAATGVLGAVAVTMIGVGLVRSGGPDRPVSTVMARFPSAGPAHGSPTGTSSSLPPVTASPTDTPGTTPDAPGLGTAAAPDVSVQASAAGAWQVQLSTGAVPADRIILPQPAALDWVLYGRGLDGTLPERVRSAVGGRSIGQLDVTGSYPTTITGMSGRFDWSGGRPQPTGKDYIDRLAAQTPGQFRLTVRVTGPSGRLDLYLGTLGVRGQIQADIDGRTVASAPLQPPQPSRWTDAVVQINFHGPWRQGVLTVTFSATDGNDQSTQYWQQGPFYQPGGGSGPQRQQSQYPPQQGQISLAAAVLSGG